MYGQKLAGALLATLLTGTVYAGVPGGVVIRDHRTESGPIVRDHRTTTGPIIRDHRQPFVVHPPASVNKPKPMNTSGAPGGVVVTTSGKPPFVVNPPPAVNKPRPVNTSGAPGGVVVTTSSKGPVIRDHRKTSVFQGIIRDHRN